LAVAESGEVETVFPGKAWVEAAPQSQGVDPERLQAALLEYLGEQMRDWGGIDSIVIARHGRLIWKGPKSGESIQVSPSRARPWGCSSTMPKFP
jgi:hypothetical protein